MPYRRRISESRVRENRMHGLMREGRGDPVLYSTLNYYNKYDRENNKTITVNPVSNYLIQNYLKLQCKTSRKINKKLKKCLTVFLIGLLCSMFEHLYLEY
jgi:hypothetical protein